MNADCDVKWWNCGIGLLKVDKGYSAKCYRHRRW